MPTRLARNVCTRLAHILARYLARAKEAAGRLSDRAVVDLARSLDRMGGASSGFLVVLVTHMKLFSYRRNDFLNALHLLAFQGFDPASLVLPRGFSYRLGCRLAGNAMTTSVLGAIIMAALVFIFPGRNEEGPLLKPAAPRDMVACSHADSSDSDADI